MGLDVKKTDVWVLCSTCEEKHQLKRGIDAPVYWCEGVLHKLIEGEFKLEEFEYLRNCNWYWTEKIDGMNIRVIWNGEKVKFRGRTDKAVIPARLLERLEELFPARKFSDFENGLTLYGEGYGVGIQKIGFKYLSDRNDFVLFDAKIGKWWLKQATIDAIVAKVGCERVPHRFTGSIDDAVGIIQAKALSHVACDDTIVEGYVGTPVIPLLTRSGHRIITKIKTKDF